MSGLTVVNMPTYRSLVEAASGLGIVARVGSVLLSMFFMLSFIVNLTSVLAVTPGYLIPPNFWIWTLVTHQFVETNFLLFACGALCLAVNSIFLEKEWGPLKLLLYYVIVSTLSAFITAMVYIFSYMVTFNTQYLFHVHIYGMGSLLGGGLVAIRQGYGERSVLNAMLQVKDLTVVGCVLFVVLSITGFVRTTFTLAYSFGAFVGWIYLRFYQLNEKGRGDQSEKFSFKYFFPEMMQQPVGIMSQIIYNLLVKLKVCRKTVYRFDVGAPGNITITLPGVDALDAERRRKKAIKALDERLKKSASDASDTPWPTLQEDNATPAVSDSSAVLQQEDVSTDEHGSLGDGSTSPDIVRIDMDANASNGNTVGSS